MVPYIVFITPLFVTLLIPVLTSFPLFFAFAGDMLAAGSILALGGFFAALASRKYATSVGDEGGLAPNFKSNEEACEVIVEAVRASGLSP